MKIFCFPYTKWYQKLRLSNNFLAFWKVVSEKQFDNIMNAKKLIFVKKDVIAPKINHSIKINTKKKPLLIIKLCKMVQD